MVIVLEVFNLIKEVKKNTHTHTHAPSHCDCTETPTHTRKHAPFHCDRTTAPTPTHTSTILLWLYLRSWITHTNHFIVMVPKHPPTHTFATLYCDCTNPPTNPPAHTISLWFLYLRSPISPQKVVFAHKHLPTHIHTPFHCGCTWGPQSVYTYIYFFLLFLFYIHTRTISLWLYLRSSISSKKAGSKQLSSPLSSSFSLLSFATLVLNSRTSSYAHLWIRM